MRRARSVWSRRRHSLAKARRPESVTAAVDPPLPARQGSGLASRARTRPGGIIALSGATGAFDRPAAAFRVYPNRDVVDPRPSGLEDSERGVAEGSGDRDRSGGEPAGARRHFSMQCSCISCGFHAGAGDSSQRNGTPTRFNNRDRIPTSRPLRAGSRARGLALDHADGLGRCLDDQAASRYRFRRPPTPDGDAAHSPWRRSQAPSSPRSPARERRGSRGRPRSRRRKGTWSQRLSSRSSKE